MPLSKKSEEERCSRGHLLAETRSFTRLKDGTTKSYCRDCRRVSNQHYYQANKQKMGAQALKWKKANPEKEAAYNKRWRAKNPETILGWRLKKYNLTVAEYKEALARQRGACAVCARTGRTLHIDHDHATAHTRALLCGNCNRALGLLHDSPDLIEKLLAYALRHRQMRLAVSNG